MSETKHDNIGQVFTAETIGAEIARQRVSRPLDRTVLHHSSSPAERPLVHLRTGLVV